MTVDRIDDFLRASAPPPMDEASARRLVGAVLDRLARRRRRLRAAIGLAGSAAALVLIALSLHLALHAPPTRPEAPTHASAAAVPVSSKRAPPPPGPRPATRRPARPTAAGVGPGEVERRIAAATSPRETARLFWEACGKLEGEPLGAFLSAVVPRLQPEGRKAIAAGARGLRDAPGRVAAGLCHRGLDGAWPLLEALLEARGPEPALIEAAGALGDARAVPMLRRWLCLADARAIASASALGRIPGSESLQALLTALDASRGAGALLVPTLREEVAASLERREDELAGYLFEAPSGVRPLVFRALAELKTPAAVASMVRALGEPELRPLARRHLASIAKKDLGPRPEDWSRWLDERLDATGGGFPVRKEST